MNHVNQNIDKNNNWILPFYSEISKLDNNGNTILIEKYDNKIILTTIYVNRVFVSWFVN